jgi:hypothetical protein
LILQPGCRLYLDGAVHDALKIDGNGKIEARENNQIFIENGGFDSTSTNGFVTTTQKPKDLQIYARGRSALLPMSINIIGQRQPFYGVVYVQTEGFVFRPYRNPITGVYDASVTGYGALVAGAGSVVNNLGGTLDFHYDESLSDLSLDGTGKVKFTIGSWQTQ